jgi:hypothetical protein
MSNLNLESGWVQTALRLNSTFQMNIVNEHVVWSFQFDLDGKVFKTDQDSLPAGVKLSHWVEDSFKSAGFVPGWAVCDADNYYSLVPYPVVENDKATT